MCELRVSINPEDFEDLSMSRLFVKLLIKKEAWLKINPFFTQNKIFFSL